MHIVVEALLIAIYLPEKDAYIHIRPTLLPEAASFSCLYTAEPSATSVAHLELILRSPSAHQRSG